MKPSKVRGPELRHCSGTTLNQPARAMQKVDEEMSTHGFRQVESKTFAEDQERDIARH